MKRILFIQYTNPGAYPPLQHCSRMLAETGWDVLFLGTGAAGANDLEFPAKENIRVRRMSFCAGGWLQKLHYIVYSLWVLVTVLVWRPSWIYSSDPFSCPIALLLTCIPGVRVLYHEHDAPAQPDKRFLSLIFRARRKLARRACMCILPNDQRLERFRSELGPLQRSACVWNCPGVYELITQPRSPAKTPFVVLYHGSIVPERLPRVVIDALTLLPSTVCLRVVGYETIGSQGYVAVLRQHAESLGIGNRVEFLPPMSRSDLMKATIIADAGLGLVPAKTSDQNFQSMPGASNKVFDYLACGVPVVVSDLSDWGEMFVAPGYGVACDPSDPQSIAAAIRSLIEDPDRMRQMGELGRQKILSDWNYETTFRPVFDYLSGPAPDNSALCSAERSI